MKTKLTEVEKLELYKKAFMLLNRAKYILNDVTIQLEFNQKIKESRDSLTG